MEEEGESGGHESSERWLVSYADFITLMFALFVLLYALSMESSDTVNRAWRAMATGVGVRPHRGGIRPEVGESGRGADIGGGMIQRQLDQTLKNLKTTLQSFQNSGVTLKMDSRGLIISLSAAKFFASGDAAVTASQFPVLQAVVQALSTLPNRMEVDGFTDSVPIHNSRFEDNWELSAARAATVLRYLLTHTKVDPQHLTLAGYGPYGAVADNSTEAGRALNRRVEIVVRPLT
ncbi:MAG TPA: flagellar motor protein MotB [Candidatus Binataceae bacterium]|nr:flagellar motor protein MotB [Candidatus Binataceae bacterium]